MTYMCKAERCLHTEHAFEPARRTGRYRHPPNPCAPNERTAGHTRSTDHPAPQPGRIAGELGRIPGPPISKPAPILRCRGRGHATKAQGPHRAAMGAGGPARRYRASPAQNIRTDHRHDRQLGGASGQTGRARRGACDRADRQGAA